jgi:phosphate transport system substrate-binding protein
MDAKPYAGTTRGTVLATVFLLMLLTASLFGYRQLNTLWDAVEKEQQTGGSGAPPKHKVTLQWVGCDICKASFMDDAAREFERLTGHRINVEDGGAGRGIKDVSRGSAHLGGTCRQCCIDQHDEQGVKLVPVAWDCLVVLVHKDNPLDDISTEQVRDIYMGGLTRWEQLTGGKHREPIVPLAREGKRSGVGYSVRQLIFKNIDQEYTAPLLRGDFKSTRSLEEALERTPHGIGISGYNSARLRLPPNGNLKMLRLDGKDPSRANVVSGQYSLYRPLYLTVPTRLHPVAEDFLAFLYSRAGQEIIRKTDTITLEEGKELWDRYKVQMQQTGRKGS